MFAPPALCRTLVTPPTDCDDVGLPCSCFITPYYFISKAGQSIEPAGVAPVQPSALAH